MPLAKASPGPFIGLGVLVCTGFLDGASVLFLPWWGVVLLCASWLVLAAAGARAFAERPSHVLPLAAVGVATWLFAVALAALAG